MIDLIIEQYAQFNLPADRIIADPATAARFADAVNSSLPQGHRFDIPALNQRLLTLRKRGEARGGLPRLGSDHP